jgi:hypothetical protein
VTVSALVAIDSTRICSLVRVAMMMSAGRNLVPVATLNVTAVPPAPTTASKRGRTSSSSALNSGQPVLVFDRLCRKVVNGVSSGTSILIRSDISMNFCSGARLSVPRIPTIGGMDAPSAPP